MDESIKKEIISWNNRFPVDKYWRQKHNIAFNSPAHREISFLDQLFEYYEEKIFEDHYKSKEYRPNIGDWLNQQQKSKSERIISLEEEAKQALDEFPDQ